jgi:glycosyltransferase involved in cell wall biosynthesis
MTAFWRRPHISRIWWASIERLTATFQAEGVEFSVVAVCSPDDEENVELARAHTPHVHVVPNTPLAAKMNTVSRGTKACDPDYAILIDSDDLLSDELARGYAVLMREQVLHIGLRDLYFYEGGTLVYWPGYPKGHLSHGRSIGCGRLYARSILDRCDWKLWQHSTRPRGMDALIDQTMAQLQVARRSAPMARFGGVAVDIKSADNIWSLAKIAELPGAEERPIHEVSDHIPEWAMVEDLTPTGVRS